MKKVLFLLFLVSSVTTSYLIYNYNQQTEKELLENATDKFTRAYNTVYDEKKELSRVIFSGLSHLGKISEYLYELKLHPEQKKEIRSILQTTLASRYKKLSELGVKQAHIHLPNNESFLRLHHPDKFGDDLSSIRPSVVYVNTFHKEIDTFEEGRMHYGLRFVYPLFYQNEYVGSMEVSFRASAITSAIMKQYYVLSNFFVRASITDEKNFSGTKGVYKSSHHPGYYYDTEVLKELKKVSRQDMKSLKPTKKISAKIKDMGEGKSPASLYSEENDAIYTAIPIINKLTKEHIAFLTVRSKANHIILAKNYTYALVILCILLLALFFYLTYLLLSKNKTLALRVREKTKELHEINEKLELQVAQQTKQIQEENERFNLVLNSIQDGIWDWDLATNRVFFSPTWKAMLGYSDDEIKNEFYEWENRLHKDDVKKTFDTVNANIEEKTDIFEIIFRMLHKDGHWVWIYARGKTIFNPHGDAVRMVGTHTDITAENSLRMELKQLSQIIEEVHDSIIVTDLDGFIKTWNKGSSDLYGYTQKEAIGMHTSNLHPAEDGDIVKESIEKLTQTGFYRHEARLLTKDKRILYAEISLSTLKDIDGNLSGFVGYAKDITDRKNMELKLDYQAHYDELTGLPNRILLQDRVKQLENKAKRNKANFALFFIDLDRFKHINDSLGHNIGDLVLQNTAKCLTNLLRKEDTIARLSGDEFIILVEGLSEVHSASNLAKKIIEEITKPLFIQEHSLYITASVGIAFYPNDADNFENLIKYSDTAMYKAKNEGRNNFQFYSKDMTNALMQRVSMETKLRQAIANEEFVVYYQPQYDASNDRIIGMEALIRWIHPTLGIIPPCDFIPLAEETGMIIQIDKWMMQASMKQISTWYEEGLKPGILSLNVTMNHLLEEDFIANLEKNLKENNFKNHRLKLEVTETQVMKNADVIIGKLQTIHDLGVNIAIDDFGTGYSSLSYLKKLPIDSLKIDKSFILDLPQDESNLKLVKTIITLGHNLDLYVIAEGVETLEQKELILENGCKYIQGYFYSRPLPKEEFEKLL